MERFRYYSLSLCDFLLTFGGSTGVIVYNLVSEENSNEFKVSFGIILVLILSLLMAKKIFEHNYREKYDTLLQQLAEATDETTKAKIAEALNKHKVKNEVYQRLMVVLPFAVLYLVTWLGERDMADMNATAGLLLASVSVGSVFNILKKPLKEKIQLQKITK